MVFEKTNKQNKKILLYEFGQKMRKSMNNRYEHMRPWRRQPNLKCILLNILMFLILVLAMLGAIYVLFLHNQSMLEKLFGVLIG